MESTKAQGNDSPAIYLNREQLSHFKNRLQRWRNDLCRVADATAEQQLFESLHPDWVDEAANKSQLEQVRVNRIRAERQIREIDEALKRISEGSYGYCAESGEEIGLKRLQAMPTAKYSLEAQELLERNRHNYR